MSDESEVEEWMDDEPDDLMLRQFEAAEAEGAAERRDRAASAGPMPKPRADTGKILNDDGQSESELVIDDTELLEMRRHYEQLAAEAGAAERRARAASAEAMRKPRHRGTGASKKAKPGT